MQERTIFDAVSDGNLDEVKQIIAQNKDALSARGDVDRTPLMKAATSGHAKIAEFLLKQRADVNATTIGGYTALLLAAFFGQTETAALLLLHGAEINTATNGGDTALHYASHSGYTKTVELLLTHKADVNLVTLSTGSTALHHAALLGRNGVASLLLKSGASVNAPSSNGDTPLHCAVLTHNVGTAHFLITSRADVNARNRNGKTPLGSLISSRNPASHALLLSHGATVASKKEAQEMEDLLKNTTTPVKMEPNPRKVGAYCSKDYLDKNDACTTFLGILTKRHKTLKAQKMPTCRDTTSIIGEILRQTPSNKFATKITPNDAPEKASRCAIQ